MMVRPVEEDDTAYHLESRIQGPAYFLEIISVRIREFFRKRVRNPNSHSSSAARWNKFRRIDWIRFTSWARRLTYVLNRPTEPAAQSRNLLGTASSFARVVSSGAD